MQKNQQNPLDNPICGFLNRNSCLHKILELFPPSIQDRSLSIIWIALDRIKQINASFGHEGGDEVIAGIARRLHNKSGVTAHWCRMAGDEFVCILPDHNSEQTRQIALAFLGEIQIPMPLHDLILYPSASLGIATLDDNETASNCLERADTAMKSAKLAGGGRVVISGSETLPGRMGIYLARHELEIENKLHLALAHGGLCLHYQPIVNSDGRIVSLEALMRCTSHQLAPGEFIPIAEKTNLIIRLGEWSLLEGARFAHRLASSGQPITVAINISRAQFSLPDFPQTLHAALLCADVNPELIELELTESLFMDNSVIVQTNLRATLNSGVKIAIDDFGTGYSCLAILKDINATKLKIDRAFIVALPHDTRAFSVVRAIAQLGNELDMLVVAEGVENQDQLASLRDAGVHTIQGYINARPMPENELLEWLKNRNTT